MIAENSRARTASAHCRPSPCLVVGALLLLLGSQTSTARAAPYRVEIAVQAGMVIDGYTITSIADFEGGGPAINDHGEIAFIARITGNGFDHFAVMTNRRVIAKEGDVIDGLTLEPSSLEEDGQPNINNFGQVSYRGVLSAEGATEPVYTLVFDNHVLARPGTTTVDGHALGTNMSLRTFLDSAGSAYFYSETTNEAETGVSYGFFSQYGLVQPHGPQEIGGYTLNQAGVVGFSPNGEHLVLRGELADGRIALATQDEVFYISGRGDDGAIRPTPLYRYQQVFDDGRTVAVFGGSNGLRYAILPEFIDLYAAAGVPVDADPRDPFAFGDGRFAYTADLPGGTGRGLYVDGELIVATGDIVGGKTILSVYVQAASNGGSFVWLADFSDGTIGYVTATPVPEPSTWAQLLLALGAACISLFVNRMCSQASPRVAQH